MYRQKSTYLSRYAHDLILIEEFSWTRFDIGLIVDVCLGVTSKVYPTFNALVDATTKYDEVLLENKGQKSTWVPAESRKLWRNQEQSKNACGKENRK